MVGVGSMARAEALERVMEQSCGVVLSVVSRAQVPATRWYNPPTGVAEAPPPNCAHIPPAGSWAKARTGCVGERPVDQRVAPNGRLKMPPLGAPAPAQTVPSVSPPVLSTKSAVMFALVSPATGVGVQVVPPSTETNTPLPLVPA